jgi:hypothetical protein
VASDLDTFLNALKLQESGGNYLARNASGASGAYQFMPGTWANYKGYATAADAPPAVQDERARQLAQQYYSQFGNWGDVAKAWYAGPGFASKNLTAKQGDYPSINDYAAQVLSKMGQPSTSSSKGSVVAQETSAAPTDPVAYARQTYGYLAAFLDDPEVGPILLKAAQEGWDLARLQGAIYATDWWKRSSESMRTWEALQAQDPAEAAAQLETQKAAIREQARQMGTPLAADRIDRIAMSAQQLGWSPQQIKSAILAEVDFANAPVSSDVGALKDKLQQIGNSYAVWIPPDELTSWAQAITSGDSTEDAFKATWAGVAKAYYNNPGLTAALDQGLTTQQYASQFVGDGANLLELNQASIDLRDPKWQRFLFPNPETGQAWTGTDFQKVLRTDPTYGYDNTARSETDARTVGFGFLQRMGFA